MKLGRGTIYGLVTLVFALLLVSIALWSYRVYIAAFLVTCGAITLVIVIWRLWIPGHLALQERKDKKINADRDYGLRDRVITIGERPGYSTKYDANGTIEVIAPQVRAGRMQVDEVETEPLTIEAPKSIPDFVRYDSIRAQIPQQHVLIGVAEGGQVDTRAKEVKGLTWIVGSSGAGKSNTTGIRVEEDYERGHRFLGIDPHFFKDDSLSNLVAGYADRFIEPMAHTDEDTLRILDLFISEVERRKQGGPCWPLTLLIDEVGSLTADKPTDKQEEEIIGKIKKCARLAGQETRGFNMNLIAISQDAAGLAWLRKRALLVIGHKVTMMSERQLVCNERTDIARAMDAWPVGRTVIYGVALQGIFIRQQPLFVPRVPGNATRNEERSTGSLYRSPTVPMFRDRLPGTPPYGMRAVSLDQEKFSSEREDKTAVTPEERQQIIELAASTPRRDICKAMGKGKWFYDAVKQVLDEEGM